MPTWDELVEDLKRGIAEQDTDDTDDLPEGWDLPDDEDEVVAIFVGPRKAGPSGPGPDQTTPGRPSEPAQPGRRSTAARDGQARQRRRSRVPRDARA